jgi:hypothetical protein
MTVSWQAASAEAHTGALHETQIIAGSQSASARQYGIVDTQLPLGAWQRSGQVVPQLSGQVSKTKSQTSSLAQSAEARQTLASETQVYPLQRLPAAQSKSA